MWNKFKVDEITAAMIDSGYHIREGQRRHDPSYLEDQNKILPLYRKNLAIKVSLWLGAPPEEVIRQARLEMFEHVKQEMEKISHLPIDIQVTYSNDLQDISEFEIGYRCTVDALIRKEFINEQRKES